MLKPAALRSCVALLAAATALGGARLAAAQAEPMAAGLTWQAPSGCPSPADVTAEVARNMAGSTARLAPYAAVVEVRGPMDGLWQATLVFQANDARSKRRFEAESCEAIASAAALVIALWAEDGADAPAPPVVTADEAPLPAVSPAPFTPPPSIEVQRNPVITASLPPVDAAPGFDPRRSQFVMMLNGLLDHNTMPTNAAGLEMTGGRIWAGQGWRLRALASGSYFPMQYYHPWDNLREAHFQVFDASTRGCFSLSEEGFEFGGCGGLELAVIRGTGEVFERSNQPWLSVLGALMVSAKLSETIAVFARGEVVVPTSQPSFRIVGDPAGGEDYYKVRALSGRGAAGVELLF